MPSGIDPEFILSLPPSTLASIPGSNPPPGQQALSPNPETLRPQVIVVGSVFLVIATVFIATRFYVKLAIVRKFALDDYVCALGYLFSVVQFSGIMWSSTFSDM